MIALSLLLEPNDVLRRVVMLPKHVRREGNGCSEVVDAQGEAQFFRPGKQNNVHHSASNMKPRWLRNKQLNIRHPESLPGTETAHRTAAVAILTFSVSTFSNKRAA